MPRSPGTLCALGAISADIVNDAVRTVHLRVAASPDGAARSSPRCASTTTRSRAELADWLAHHGAGAGSATFRHAADMRYVGQSYEIEVPVEPAWLAPGGGAALLAALPPRRTSARSATPIREAPAEIVNLRVQLRAARPRVPLGEVPAGRGAAGAARDAPDLARRPPHRGARVRARDSRPRRARWPAPPSSSSPTRPCSCRPATSARSIASATCVHPEGRLMRLDALTVEILRNYLQGAVEEMAYVVERTAYTTFVKETADFTCGLLNPSGEFFAYPIELGVASFGGHQLRGDARGGRARSSPATSSSPTTRTARPPPPRTCPTST